MDFESTKAACGKRTFAVSARTEKVNPRQMPAIAKSTMKPNRRNVAAMTLRYQVAGDLTRSRFLGRDERALRAVSRERCTLANGRRKRTLHIHALIGCLDLSASKLRFTEKDWRDEVTPQLKPGEWFLLCLFAIPNILPLDAAVGVSEFGEEGRTGHGQRGRSSQISFGLSEPRGAERHFRDGAAYQLIKRPSSQPRIRNDQARECPRYHLADGSIRCITVVASVGPWPCGWI